MPCRTEEPNEKIRRRERENRERENQDRKDAADAEAGRLLNWLEEVLGVKQEDNTSKLCGRIRSMQDQDFINIMVSRIDQPEARELLGWWEGHKKYDKAVGR